MDKILLRGEDCKTRKNNSIFLNKGKTVISVENQKFSRSRMTKQTSSLNSFCEIYLPCLISLDFKTIGILCFLRHRGSGDTWHDHVDFI